MGDKTHSSRLTAYKNAGQGMTDLRRKRAELSLTLRKQAREEQLLKRRAVSPEASATPSADEPVLTPEEIVLGLRAKDLPTLIASARAARRVLSKEQNPPITSMVQAGVIAPLVDSLDRDDCAELQFEAAWALTNIASGTTDHTMAVISGGAIPKLIGLLSLGGTVSEQAAWALGNIAGDGPGTRDAVLCAGALPALLPALTPGTAPAQLRTNVWTYSNLCRRVLQENVINSDDIAIDETNKSPMVEFSRVSPALPHIAELLAEPDADVLADACWALSYLTDGPNERIEAVQTTPGLTTRLVALLEHRAAAVRTPALRALGNMLTGSDRQTDRCLAAGCLPRVLALLRCGKPSLVKEAAWAASNILAGTHDQIQAALDHGVLAPLLDVLTDGEPRCQKEAAWAITNLCLGGSAPQLDALLSAGFLEPYCRLLAASDHRAVALVLDGLSHLLQAAVKYGQLEALCLRLEESGVLDQLERLQRHENEQVYKKTLHLLDTYFAEGDENAQPKENATEFQFGTDQPPTNFKF